MNDRTIGSVRNVGDDDFDATVLASALPVLVDFWAEWCGPCRVLGPVIEELAGDYASKLCVIKVNVDESPKTASRFGVRSIPTVVLFRDGKPVEAMIGAPPKSQLVELIDRELA